MPDDDVLRAERAHLGRARADLARMRERTRTLLDTQTTWGNDELTTRALSASLLRRYDQLLDDGVTPLFFGRLDTDQDEVFHVGRRHVSGLDGEPVVLDWRAPVSGAYYRASGQDRQGMRLRRRFGFRDGALTAYEDDRLTGGEGVSALLVQEVERPRSGPMRDIVATVQPEQDLLVRAPLEQTVCVQGASGTGKTAVGLHRAAYLLYAHRARLAATGVLVVGPNRAFLSYVQEVLPALGEVAVTQATADELAPAVRVRREASEDEAQVKGDARMAVVLERALWRHAVRASEPLVLTTGSRRFRLWPEDVRGLERAVRGRALSWNASRPRSRAPSPPRSCVSRTARGCPRATGPSSCSRGARRDPLRRRAVAAADTRAPGHRRAARRRASCRSGGGRADARGAAAAGHRTGRPLVARRPAAARRGGAPVGAGRRLCARRRRRGARPVRDAAARRRTAVRHRERHRARRPGSGHHPRGAGRVVRGAPAPRQAGGSARRADLTGYRVPREVLELANRLLPHIAPGIAPAASLRSVPGSLEVRRSDDLVGDAVSAVRRQASKGSVAVVAADVRLLDAVGAGVTATGVPAEPLAEGAPPAAVCLVPASLIKGLEFDSVLLLEPAAIAASGAHGLRLLYVALTRAVSSLLVLHEAGLPVELAAGPPGENG